MIITYKSPAGSFTADGGEGKNHLKVREYEGLGLPPKGRSTVTYPGRHGQSCTGFVWEPRTITLGLDLLLTGGEAKEFEYSMMKAVSEDGTLIIGNKEIECSVATITPAQICKGNYPRYAVQFICDYPYFRDTSPTVTELYKRTGYIKSTFQFPLIMSKLINNNVVVNDGQTRVEPVITIRTRTFSENAQLQEETPLNSFVITNAANGAIIELDLSGFDEVPSVITVDVPNRRIYSDNADLTHLISDNIFMCDFVLEVGENPIKATWGGDTELFAQVTFRKEYLQC